MTKKVLIILSFITLCSILFTVSGANSNDSVSISSLKNAWQTSNCNAQSTNMSIYATLKTPVLKEEKIISTINSLIKDFNIKDYSEIKWIIYEGYKEATLVGKINDEDYITLSLQSFYSDVYESEETNLLINIDGSNNIDRLIDFQNLVEEILEKTESTGQLNCSILGYVDSKESEEDILKIIEILVKEMQCDIKDFFVDNHVISICGNSPFLPENPYGWTFNMQITARRDDKGNYYVWLGYPAIASSY